MCAQENVGPYRLVKLVRAGKTCEVWDVLNDAQGERRALKLLSGDYAKNKEEVAFLKHEFQVGKPLDHPNVIKIYDFGRDHENVYLVMELFNSPNLKQHIVQGIESLAPIAQGIIRKAAEGLSYFHQHGWVHRDIKPDNYLVTLAGDVKLIDFALAIKPKSGIAKWFASKTNVQGTRSYMSPEQIRGLALDQRADVYSFGCMVFELLSGKPPYTGTSSNDLLNKHLRAPVPPIQAMNRNISDNFAGLLRTMLAKNPGDRPASMADFLSELQVTPIFKIPPSVRKQTANE